MQSVTSNAVSKAMSYSKTEHFTGKYWFDGRKIYSKTFEFGAVSANSRITISVSNLHIRTAIKAEGYGLTVGGDGFMPITYPDRSVASILSYYVDRESIYIFTGTSRSVDGGHITLEYTKTTD